MTAPGVARFMVCHCKHRILDNSPCPSHAMHKPQTPSLRQRFVRGVDWQRSDGFPENGAPRMCRLSKGMRCVRIGSGRKPHTMGNLEPCAIHTSYGTRKRALGLGYSGALMLFSHAIAEALRRGCVFCPFP